VRLVERVLSLAGLEHERVEAPRLRGGNGATTRN
jgi:hypothetical protein